MSSPTSGMTPSHRPKIKDVFADWRTLGLRPPSTMDVRKLSMLRVNPRTISPIISSPSSPLGHHGGRRRPSTARVGPRSDDAVAPRGLVRGRHRDLHELVIRGEMADRVGAGGVTGERERLAAAAAEVELTTLAAAARVRHPRLATEPLEQRRLLPDPGQRVLAHVGRGHAESA